MCRYNISIDDSLMTKVRSTVSHDGFRKKIKTEAIWQ